MKRREFLKRMGVHGAFLSAFGMNALAATGKSDRPPNIVFIFADDWGYGDLSCHGNEMYSTPNIDRMATQGIDFKQFTVANPVCSPSRTAVMTGHFPARKSGICHLIVRV